MFELFPSREIILSVGSVDLRWYGMMYFFAFIAGLFIVERCQKYRNLSISSSDLDHFLYTIVLSVVVGGRLGYVLFWNPSFYFGNPLEIFAVWNGGMSSHGGMLATFIATLVVCRKKNVDFWAFADVGIIAIAFGLGLGRIGNFINQELYGTPTALPWAIAVPGVSEPRHPAQMYALIKDWFIAAVLLWHVKSTARNFIAGRTLGYFFLMYGMLRFLVEYVRVQPEGYYQFGSIALSRGQLLTIPVFVAGLIVLSLRRGTNRS